LENDAPSYYIAIPQHIIADVNLSPTAKLLYGVIDSFQCKTGVCYATNERLAQELAGCSERTVSRCVSELKDAGLVSIVTEKDPQKKQKCRKIYLLPSMPDGHGVDNFVHPHRQNCRGGIDKNGDKVTNISNTEKKKAFDPLVVFVSWIQDKLGDDFSTDVKNTLYLHLRRYAEMRADSKSPLNTKRKVDGLLEDLLEQSGGDVALMCEMLQTAKRRCWLSVHAPKDKTAGSTTGGRQYECL
jgi:hypothetical protein